MYAAPALAIAAALILAGCGGGDSAAPEPPRYDRSASEPEGSGTAAGVSAPKAATAAGTTIVVRGSEFGTMLFGPGRQAIYIFQRDRRNESRCHGECARLWPPVYANGRPRAGRGVKASLLGTTRRRGGRMQVTYNGKPLYYYAHEGPGEVKCHNVFLNGGLWWVIGPNGKRRA